VSDGNNFGSFYGDQNVHLNENGRQFRLHYVKGPGDTVGVAMARLVFLRSAFLRGHTYT